MKTNGEKSKIAAKVLIAFILILFSFTTILGGTLLLPSSAQAQMATAPVTEAPATTVREAKKSIAKKIGEAMLTAGKVALKNGVKYFLRKAAYDAAIYLAKKGAGQETQVYKGGWKNYLKNATDGAAGTFLQSLGEENGFVKLNFCEPDFQVKLGISLGLLDVAKPQEPKCTFSKMKKNWKNFIGNFKFSEKFQTYFNPTENDFGVQLGLQTKLIERIAKKEREATIERWGKDIKDKIDPITKAIKTPGSFIRDSIVGTENASRSEMLAFTGDVLADTLDTFSSTLLATFWNLKMKGWFGGGDIPSAAQLSQFGGAGVVGGAGRAQAVADYYASLGRPRFRSAGVVDILTEFEACPEKKFAKINNCTLDASFAQAIRQRMTVKEAIDQNLLHGNWIFGYTNPVSGVEPNFQEGYAASNMRKLRKARILPLGWELAAKKVREDKDQIYTLGDMVNAFNDNNSSFYHLVDPNWLLKAPAQKCDQLAYGESVTSLGTREEVCVDTKTCLKESANGSCEAWGYCDREKNVWNFKGQECPAYYNSCETFTDTEGKEVSYLENTLDKGACDASNAGCGWYCDSADGAGNWTCSLDDSKIRQAGNKKVFFNSSAEECEAKDAGCGELISTSGALGTNLIKNSSFEDFTGTPGNPNLIFNWNGSINIVSDSFFGSYAAKVANGTISNGLGKLRQGAAYVASVWFKADSGITATLKIAGDGLPIGENGNKEIEITGNGNGNWQRIVTDPVILLTDSNITLSLEAGSGEVVFDAVQLEEGFAATNYSDYGSKNSIFLKKAPEYLDCNSNPALCAGYAPSCSASEVGCELYTPLDGDPAVPGQVRPEDLCPAECVGYDTFIKKETDFEDGGEPAYFIPATTRGCSAEVAGCEEFTNLETEQIEYYANIRRCEKPTDAVLPVFYTWEGSEVNGYKLQSWNLKANGDTPTCFDGTDSCVCDSDQTDPNNANYNPDCREFYSSTGVTSYILYSKTVTITPDCQALRQTQEVGESVCGSKGGTFDTLTNSCIFNAYAPESKVCSAAQNGCREYKGNAAENVAVVLSDSFEDGSVQGWQGSAGKIGNRAESVNVGGRSLFVNTASGVDVENATPTSGQTNPPTQHLNNSIAKNITNIFRLNKTYELSFWAKGQGQAEISIFNADGAVFSTIDTDPLTATVELKPAWQKFNLGPVITTTASHNKYYLVFTFGSSGQEVYLDNIILKETQEDLYLIKDSWTTPASCDTDNFGNRVPQAQLGCDAYYDRDGNTVNLKSFDNLCREEAVGCEEFIDTKNNDSAYNVVYNAVCWRSTNDLNSTEDCENSLGEQACTIEAGKKSCRYNWSTTGVTNLQINNGDKRTLGSVCTDIDGCPYEVNETVTLPGGATQVIPLIKCWVEKGKSSCLPDGDESTVEVPADSLTYLVNDEKYSCGASEKGCQTLGVPSISPDDRIEGWGVTYLKNDPNKYAANLCGQEALGCGEYQAKSGFVYFKNPNNKLCEYRSKVSVGGQIVSGWFRRGSNDPCYNDYQDDSFYGIWRNADAGYTGFTGLCRPQYSGCEEFVDPADTTPSNPQGQAYYFLDNNQLDRASCNGQVSLKEGCVLFDQTSNPNKYWNAEASYNESESQDNKLVNPSTLPAKDTNTILKVERDRQCAEWIGCSTASRQFDQNTGKFKDICYDLARCDQLDTSRIGNCGATVSKKCQLDSDCQRNFGSESVCENISPATGIGNCSVVTLSANNYKNRNVSWYGWEYSGESYLDSFPIDELSQVKQGYCLNDRVGSGRDCSVNIEACEEGEVCVDSKCRKPCSESTDCNNSATLGAALINAIPDINKRRTACQNTPGFNGIFVGNICYERSRCSSGYYLAYQKDGDYRGFEDQSCLISKDCPFGQTCINKQCVLEKSCRSYPKDDSPFDSLYKNDLKGDQINFCQNGEDCECSYNEAKASGVPIYISLAKQPFSKKICIKGQNKGKECSDDSDCNNLKDACQPISEVSTLYGQRGYCLERDPSRAINGQSDQFSCLSWLPLPVLEGEINLLQFSPEAGYTQKPGRNYYCEEAKTESQILNFSTPGTLWGNTNHPTINGYVIPNDNNNGMKAITSYDWIDKLNLSNSHFNDYVWINGNNWIKNIKEGAIKSSLNVNINDFFGPTEGSNPPDSPPRESDIGGGCKELETPGAWCRWPGSSRGWQNNYPLLGCYEIKAGGDIENPSQSIFANKLFIPYIGPTIYMEQIDEINIGFDPGRYCNSEHNDDVIRGSTKNLFSGLKKQNNWRIVDDGSQAIIVVEAKHTDGENPKFEGIILKVKDKKNQGTFIIDFFEISFKIPSCSVVSSVASSQIDPDFKTYISFPLTENMKKLKEEDNTPCPPVGATSLDLENPDNISTFNTLVVGNEEGNNDCYPYSGDVNKTQQQLREMFAVIFIKGSYNISELRYSPNELLHEDLRRRLINNRKYPHIYPVNFSGGRASIDRDKNGNPLVSNRISINERISGYVGNIKNPQVTASFYMEADPNQMPIRGVWINWGDGTRYYSGSTKLKNYLDNCDGDPKFAHGAEGCKEDYLNITHIYSKPCNSTNPAWEDVCPNTAVDGGCCVYHPKAVVQDWWGLCSNGSNGIKETYPYVEECKNLFAVNPALSAMSATFGEVTAGELIGGVSEVSYDSGVIALPSD